jgi:hypothetical protein
VERRKAGGRRLATGARRPRYGIVVGCFETEDDDENDL